MSEITIIGLGDMGSALARTLLEKGHRVTVWNRTKSRGDALVEQGATFANDVAEAVAASPITIVCVTKYEHTHELFDTEAVIRALPGKLIVQLTTGTPQEARDSETWTHSHGAEYVDGAIFATPWQIGQADTPILVSGSPAAYQTVKPFLKLLAGQTKFVGEPVGAASAWDLASLSYVFGGLIGFIHGIRLFESEGLPIGELTNFVADAAPIVGEMVRHEGKVIETEAYENPGSSLQISAYTFDHLVKQAKDSGISDDFPAFGKALFKKGMDAGYGPLEVAALVKVMRESA